MISFTEEQKKIIQDTKEYLCALPNGSHLTMLEAMYAVCPSFQESNSFIDLFSLHNEIEKEVGKTDTILDFLDHEGFEEGLPFKLGFYVWQKRLQKVRIISNLLCYGPEPAPEDPVEQHLTISYTGRIWFTEYIYGEGHGMKYPIVRRLQFSIGKERTARILSCIDAYLKEEKIDMFVTDIGDWEMTAYRVDGSVNKAWGSMIGNVKIGDVNLSDYIRSMIEIKELAVFG